MTLLLLLLLSAAQRDEAPPPGAIWLDSLGVKEMSAGWGAAQACKSIERQPLRLGGVTYAHGIGTHANSEELIDLKGVATRFEALVGVDDERAGKGSVLFHVYVDDRLAASAGPMHGGQPPKRLSVDLRGKQALYLVAGDAGDGVEHDHADWAGALLYLDPTAKVQPVATGVPVEPAPEIAYGVSPIPAIHGPRVTGCTPGHPFLFRIPATGAGPLTFTARGLPPGIQLDKSQGILSGAVTKAGSYRVALTVRGPRGVGRRTLTIVAGEKKLALTPPMGWNSWYVWYGAVDDRKMRAAADGLIASGLAAHGYQYVCIDDCWEGKRSASGEIEPNEKFSDMRALGDYIHAYGLRFGIYSSPGPKTCGGYEGSYRHELQDAQTYAKWGVDFLKHDWCSYESVATGTGLERFQRPYRLMREALDRVDRDMVYSLCQYGMGNVWEWGDKVGSNLWRTTGDSGDTWSSVSTIGFAQAGHEKWAGPGRWNDPDMLMMGWVGGEKGPRPTRLTPNEQIAQMTLWSMIAAPLLLSNDLTRIDRFTLAVLANDEVLDVNQDPLGRAAGCRVRDGLAEVWSRPLFDGTTAVALFNRGVRRRAVTVPFSAIGAKGQQQIRDLWKHKELGASRDSFTASVPAHGAVMVRIGRPSHSNHWE